MIRPSSREQENLLPARLVQLRNQFATVIYEDLPPDPDWAYTASSPAQRAKALSQSLLEQESHFILCARGGYGASDLLDIINFQELAQRGHKFIVGFSDISALHSAFYTKLGWPGIHGPMPATSLWQKNSALDTDELATILRSIHQDGRCSGRMPLTPIFDAGIRDLSPVEGTLFGGCFSVLTNLIGTPYFPSSLDNHIVFIEDTDEHPGRLMRALNQWIQSGKLRGVSALIIGYLKALGEKIPDNAPFVLQRIAQKVHPIPVFHTPLLGHTSPNFPLVIGSKAMINPQKELIWKWELAASPKVI